MSDKYFNLQSFKYGLDGRREVLTSVPGTLATFVNGFINEGGEIEQRKSFVRDAHDYPSNTFGLEVTDSGLMTFGSDASPNATLPTGVVYQRLQHPSDTTRSMTNVLFSFNYLGKAYVCALFNDGRGFLYYDGTLVDDSRDGYVLTVAGVAETVSQLASDLATQINALDGWRATANVDQLGNTVAGYVLIKTPPGVHITPTFTILSTDGAMGSKLIAQNGPGSAGTGATATFSVTSNGTNGTVTVSAPLHQSGSGTAVLANAVARNAGGASNTAADIAAAINVNSIFFGYTAKQSGANVTVYAPLDWGASANGFTLTVHPTGDITIGAGTLVTGFQANLSPRNLEVLRILPLGQHGSRTVSGFITVQTSGASGAITYAWTETDEHGNALPVGGAGGSGISMSSTNTASVGFSKTLGENRSVQGYFKVVVTNGPTIIPINFYVLLELDNLL